MWFITAPRGLSEMILTEGSHSAGHTVACLLGGGRVGRAETRAGGWRGGRAGSRRNAEDGLKPQGREGDVTGRDKPCVTEESTCLGVQQAWYESQLWYFPAV